MQDIPPDENDQTRRKIAELTTLSARLKELEDEMRSGLERIAELMDPACSVVSAHPVDAGSK